MTDAFSNSEQPSEATRCIEPQSTAKTAQPMTTNTPREHLIEFTDEANVRRRIRFVPRETAEWLRIEERWAGYRWQCVERSLVTDLDQWSRPRSE